MKTKVMDLFKTTMVAILLVVLVFNFVGMLLGFIISSTIMEPTFLIQNFKEQEGYAQTRNVIFRLIGSSLPNGQESIPYLEKAITEDWLEDEINIILKQFYDFTKGNRRDTPIIPIYEFKRKVVDALDNGRSYEEKTRLVQFWFDPLPDEVRFEDFLSIDMLWGARRSVAFMKWLPWIMMGGAVLIIALIFLVVKDWKDLILWAGLATMASGALIILLVLMGFWARGYMSIFINIIQRIEGIGISETIAEGLINGFVSGIIKRINLVGITSIIIGGFMVFFAPVEERILTIIK